MLETPEEKEFCMTAPVQSLTRALMFAAQKHTDQRRKGARAEPYANHLIDVVDT